MDLIFEWDEIKAQKNLQKHGVGFEEGKTVFYDPFLLTFPDNVHSDDEFRFINIGVSTKMHTLLVVHTERDKSIRIISCRKATKSETIAYEKRI
jgi:uncharacterized DUF497 family protein